MAEQRDSEPRLHAPPGGATGPVVEAKIISAKGARVTETVFILSSRAASRLEIKGEVPARPKAGR
jgi:hypothetical protein